MAVSGPEPTLWMRNSLTFSQGAAQISIEFRGSQMSNDNSMGRKCPLTSSWGANVHKRVADTPGAPDDLVRNNACRSVPVFLLMVVHLE